MRMVVKCSGCNTPLNIKEGVFNLLGDVEVMVDSCGNIDCYDCSKCEVEKKLQSVQEKISDIKKHIEETTK